MKNIIIFSLLLTLAACQANKRYLAMAKRDFYRGNPVGTLRHLQRPLATKDPKALYALGYMYYYGQGVVENKPYAKQLFQQAAAQGNQDAGKALQMIARAEKKART